MLYVIRAIFEIKKKKQREARVRFLINRGHATTPGP